MRYSLAQNKIKVTCGALLNQLGKGSSGCLRTATCAALSRPESTASAAYLVTGGTARGNQLRFSIMPAIPWPPPTQAVTMP
jgi:hypothetical protein